MNQKAKNERYTECVRELQASYTPFEMARWFALGKDDSATLRNALSPISRKILPEGNENKRNVTVMDVVCIQLLAFLDGEGYDLSTLRFDEECRLVQLNKRPL